MINMRLSKEAKARIRRLSASQRGAMAKNALRMADCNLITMKRYEAIVRALGRERFADPPLR